MYIYSVKYCFLAFRVDYLFPIVFYSSKLILVGDKDSGLLYALLCHEFRELTAWTFSGFDRCV